VQTKLRAEYTDNGFGFPVILESVPMIFVRGRWTPNINYENLARVTLRFLAELDGRLSGNQIKFIRQFFEMTLQQFSARFGVSHPAVMKWERSGNKVTGMNWSTEKDIRLFVVRALEDSPSSFVDLYKFLELMAPPTPQNVRVNARRLAA